MKNTDKSFIIEVTNRQTIDGETNSVTERAEGSFYIRGSKHYIIYRLRDDNGETSSTVIFDGAAVNVKRNGFTSLNVCYDTRTETKTHFLTPYGKIPMNVLTERIFADFNDNGGVLEIDYTSSVQGDEYINRVTIKVKEKIEEVL